MMNDMEATTTKMMMNDHLIKKIFRLLLLYEF